VAGLELADPATEIQGEALSNGGMAASGRHQATTRWMIGQCWRRDYPLLGSALSCDSAFEWGMVQQGS